MRKVKFIVPVLTLLLFVACRDKGTMREFNTTIEPLTVASDEKVYIDKDERLLYWEPGDSIIIVQNQDLVYCPLVGSAGHTALFKGGPFTDDVAYAFHPQTMVVTPPSNNDGDGTWSLVLPRKQRYRQPTDNSIPADSSFGKGVLPMVSFIEPGTMESNIIFHVVGGVLRLQFYGSSLTQEFTIDSIQFESKDHNISGKFTMSSDHSLSPDCNPINLQSVEPVLTENNAGSKFLTITDINRTIGGNGDNKYNLFTFYLPLPVTQSDTMLFKLRVTVFGKQGGQNRQCQKVLQASIHRSNITKMPAVGITNVVASGTGSTTNPDQMIVGNGTPERPFQIYTAQELKLVAEAMANPSGRINGQLIRGKSDPNPTYFKVVRSDITLLPPSDKVASDPKAPTSVEWFQGIQNFRGIMYFASSTAQNGGITNISGVPLFESISSEGEVREIYVKGTSTVENSSTPYSPLCQTNNGTMIDCHNLCNVTTVSNRALAGVCVYNNGTIDGCSNEGILTSNDIIAGLCYQNNAGAEIKRSFIPSTALPHGARVGGLVYTNSGAINNCQVSVNQGNSSSTGNWGVVVFVNNSGGLIHRCVSTGVVALSTSGSIGGICFRNNGGDIDYCRNELSLKAGVGSMGGIVAYMVSGYVYNCYTDGNTISGTASVMTRPDNAGGIVGDFTGGHVYNCYNNAIVEAAVNNGGLVGQLGFDADIQNCWGAGGHNFYGRCAIRDNDSGGQDTAQVGDYCFGRAPDRYVNRLKKNEFVDSIMYRPDPTEPGNLAAGQQLKVYLNAWRTSHTDRTYLVWDQSSNLDAPYLIDPEATTKAKKKRK